MTAKEMYKEMAIKVMNGETHMALKYLSKFPDLICREQRKLCADALTGTAVLDKDLVINAPMPPL